MLLFAIAMFIPIVILICLLIYKLFHKDNDNFKLTDLAQVILMATLVMATIFYAQDTRNMALEMRHANLTNLRPYLDIIPMQPYYDQNSSLIMPYALVNTGNTSLFYKKSHRVFRVNKESGQKEEIKPWCREPKYTGQLVPKQQSAIHIDDMGRYFIKEENLSKENFLIELRVDFKGEEDFGYGTFSVTKLVAFSAKSYIKEGRNEFFPIYLPPKYDGFENN